MPHAAALRARAALVSRIAASLLGGYAFVWGFVVLCIALLLRAGWRYGPAQTAAYLLAFLVFLGAFLWSYAEAKPSRVWAVLAGGGAAMTALGWWLARGLA